MDELRTVLELATDDELQHLTNLLFSRGLNPLDYIQSVQPIDILSRERTAVLDAIEQRFRYLAADGLTVLRGCTEKFTYRQTLIKVCQYLKIPYSQTLSTTDLEAEVFLHLLGKAWQRLPQSDQEALIIKVQRSLAQSKLPEPLPLSVQKDPIGLVLKAGGALAVTSVIKPIILQQIVRQFTIHFARHQVAKNAIINGSATLQNYITAQTAKRGMAIAAARYGSVRTALAWLGPVLWTWLLADLGWRSISTNYSRIIPTIFTLAQIRLTRSECWELA